MALGMPDELLPVFVPPAVYWVVAGVYHLVLGSTDKHRLFTKEEEDTQNLASRRQVVVGVLVNQAAQMALAALMFMGQQAMGSAAGAAAPSPSLLKVAWQLAVGMLIMDCWEYFWHRWTHENKFMYKHVHAMHHHLIVPYPYGAQYIHPVDAFGGEIIGSLMATLIPGISPRTSAMFFTLLTLKGLDDHCGMWFPNYHPIHRWMVNNTAFHAVHHQHKGLKYNYSVHYLATWDLLLGTYLPYAVEDRKGGGYLLRIAKDQ